MNVPQEEIGATTRLGASMQPAMEAGNPAKGKPAQATAHGEVEDHKAHGCRDFDHGDQIVDLQGRTVGDAALAPCVRLAAYSQSIGLFAAAIPAACRPQPPEHRCTWRRIHRR